MTSKQFIEKCVSGKYDGKEKNFCSIYFDGEHIYSYGKHYPLLVHIGNAWILNQQGYSHTTGKHISWARDYADYVTEIPNTYDRYDRSTLLNAEGLKDVALRNLRVEEEILAKLTARATRQRPISEERIHEFTRTVAFLASQILEGVK